MSYFDCGKRLEVKFRVQGAKGLQKVDIPFRRQTGVETSDHMNLGDSLLQSVARGTLDLRDRHLEGVGVAFTGTESAKLTGKHANIGIVNITVEDIGRAVAVFALTDDVGDLAEGIKIVRTKQSKSLLLADPLSIEDSLMNIAEGWRDQPRVCEIFHKPSFTHNQTSGKQTPWAAPVRRNSYLLRRFIGIR
jgi:hypothetical protein